MMIETCRGSLPLFNRHWVCEFEDGISFTECSAGGRGTATFAINGFGIQIKVHNQPPLIWALAQRKCADGAFLTFEDDGFVLHIVELKKTMGLDKWAHVQQQLQGMYLSALAICGLLSLQKPTRVVCYVAMQSNLMDPLQTSASVGVKTAVGGTKSLGGRENWTRRVVPLPFGVTGALRSASDAGFSVDFGTV